MYLSLILLSSAICLPLTLSSDEHGLLSTVRCGLSAEDKWPQSGDNQRHAQRAAEGMSGTLATWHATCRHAAALITGTMHMPPTSLSVCNAGTALQRNVSGVPWPGQEAVGWPQALGARAQKRPTD